MNWRKSSFSGHNGSCVEVGWRKSSFSGHNGSCVEVGWRKSSYSGQNGTCVEVAVSDPSVGVRDSKNVGAGHLTLASTGWHVFVGAVKSEKLAH